MTAPWNEFDPGQVFHPATDEEWNAALARYLDSRNDDPLLRCVEVARGNGARTLVVEMRYIDLDYRSEFSAYHSRQFASVPDTAHRLHFFRSELAANRLWGDVAQDEYLGYVSVRPTPQGRVSRAMLKPPADLADAVRTAVTEHVNFFGTPLTVTGVPFAQQDTELGACAHAAAWMCHYTAHLRGDAARHPKAAFSLLADSSLYAGRAVPTGGLTVHQLGELFRTLGTPAILYQVGNLPSPELPNHRAFEPPEDAHLRDPGTWDHRIVPVACRHLNSGLPVLVGTADHAFVLIGYRRTLREDVGWIEFLRHDDEAGPYLLVDDVLADIDPVTAKDYGPWVTLQVPTPSKLWLDPETAEVRGGTSLLSMSDNVARLLGEDLPDGATPYADLHAAEDFTVRTYAVASNDFKANLRARGVDEVMQREYRMARLPRYIVVVEAIARSLRHDGQPCVLGEVIFDATSSRIWPEMLAANVLGVMYIERTNGEPRQAIRPTVQPYLSGGVGPP